MIRIQLVLLAVAGGLATGIGPAHGSVLVEDFSSDPSTRGWFAVGDTNLFHWNGANQALDVTWDSSKPNSYYAHPLGTALGRHDDFTLGFDLRLKDFAAGNDLEKPNPFQLSVALINLGQAQSTNFIRGTGYNSPNLVEFSFFPDPGGAWQWGPSITAALIDSTGQNWSSGGFAPAALSVDDVFHVTMTYSGREQVLHTTITRNGQPFLNVSDATLGAAFTDFQVGHIAVASYSDAGQDPAYSGSILAHGTVDNLTVTAGSRVVGSLGLGSYIVSVSSQTNASYVLERTTDFGTWQGVSLVTAGTGEQLNLTDTNAPAAKAFYRVRIEPR